MEWVIGYGIGALLFAFVVTVLSVLSETEAEQKRTMQLLLLLSAVWPFTATVFVAGVLGAWIKRR